MRRVFPSDYNHGFRARQKAFRGLGRHFKAAIRVFRQAHTGKRRIDCCPPFPYTFFHAGRLHHQNSSINRFIPYTYIAPRASETAPPEQAELEIPASSAANGSACQSRLLPSARLAPMQGASLRPCGTAWGLPPGHHAVPLSADRNTCSRYYKDITDTKRKKWNESVSFDGGIHSLYGLTSEFNILYINNFIFLVKCFLFLFIF